MADKFDPETMMDYINTNNVDEHKRMVLKVLRFVCVKSPVDEGTYKANNKVSSNSPDTVFDKDTKDNAKGTPGKTFTRGAAIVAKIDGYEKTYVQNNVPYAVPIEMGHSEQQSNGVYRLAAQAVGGSS